MKIKEWIKIEEFITDLIGWKKGIDEMCEAHREVAPKKAIYCLGHQVKIIAIIPSFYLMY